MPTWCWCCRLRRHQRDLPRRSPRSFRRSNCARSPTCLPRRQAARAEAFGVAALSPDELLARDDIDIVLNLTIPAAHAEVGLAAIAAGKHVYPEKPLAAAVAEARALVEAAEAAGLRIGCAPDTFLGGAHQTARALVDAGRSAGRSAGTAVLMLAGPRALAPEPRLLLPAGRRAAAGHGALLHDRDGQPARPGGARLGACLARTRHAHHRHRPARRRDRAGRGRHARGRGYGIRLRRARPDRHQLRRAQPTGTRRSNSTAPRARC